MRARHAANGYVFTFHAGMQFTLHGAQYTLRRAAPRPAQHPSQRGRRQGIPENSLLASFKAFSVFPFFLSFANHPSSFAVAGDRSLKALA